MPLLSTFSSASVRDFGRGRGGGAGLFDFTSGTFTSPLLAGTYGSNTPQTWMYGPTNAQLLSMYTGNLYTLLNNNVYFKVPVQGVQAFCIPATGNYKIVARGAPGGNSSYAGGLGAYIEATFAFEQSDILWMSIGQAGAAGHTTASDYCSAGGGGATFVAKGTKNQWLFNPTNVGTNLICAAGGLGAKENRFATTTPSNSSTYTTTAGSGWTSWITQSINGALGGYNGLYSAGGYGLGKGTDDQFGGAGGNGGTYQTTPENYIHSSATNITVSGTTSISSRSNPGYVTLIKL